MKKIFILSIVLLSLSLHGDDFTKICKVVRSNDSGKLEALLSDIKTLRQTDKNGRTLLFCASETGAYKSAELLLKKGIDPNIKDDQNLTVFNVLIEKENRTSNRMEQYDYIKMALLLLDYGANVNSTDKYGNTLLMETYSPEIVRLLLAYGADINSTNKVGHNILHRYEKYTSNSDKAKVSILKSLLDYGANIEIKDKNGKRIFDFLNDENKFDFFKQTQYPKKLEPKIVKNFLIIAMKKYDYEMIELLLKMGSNANAKNSYSKKPIILKAMNDSKMVEIFIKYGLDLNMTFNPYKPKSLLEEAIGDCTVDSVGLILEHYKKSINNFHTAASIVNCDDAEKSVEIVDLLLQKGLDIAISDKQGHTLLHLAAKESKVKLCHYLLDKGLDANMKDKEKATPLLYAMSSTNDTCAKVLLKAGADIHYTLPGNITLLHVAVKNNHIDLVKQLLEQGLDPNVTDKKGRNVLELAANNANLDMMKLLLQKGANIKAVDLDGDSVLHYACGWDKPIDTVKFLLEKGLDVNLKNKKGQTTLFNAAKNDNLSSALYLIDHKAKINIQDSNGNTPLHLAVKKSNKHMIVLLLLKGADASIKNKDGLTALELEIKEHSYDTEVYNKIFSGKYQAYFLDKKSIFSFKNLNDIVLYLANGGDLKVKNDNTESLLHIAAKTNGNAEIIDYLLALGIDPNFKDSEGRTALHMAAQFSSNEGVHSLLQYGAKIDIKDKNQLTPVDYAIVDIKKRKDYLLPVLQDMQAHGLVAIPWKNSKANFLLNEVPEKLDLLSFLIKHGADVNSVDNDGDTSLMTCAVHNYDKSAKILIDAGANIDIQNNRGRTALYTSTVLNSYETAEILLKNGANGDLKTKDGSSPLLNAVRKNDHKMVSLLMKYSIDPNISNKQKDTVLHMAVMNANENIVKALIQGKVNPNKVDELGLTPLDYAKSFKLKKLITLLEPITTGKRDVKPEKIIAIEDEKKTENNISSVKAEDENIVKYGQSKLHQAVSSQNLDAVRDLLADHIEIDVIDKLGRTPLHYAAIRGYVEIAALLLDKGANINAVDSSKQWTPLFYATFMGHQKMIELLLTKGANVTFKDKFNRTVNDYKKDK